MCIYKYYSHSKFLKKIFLKVKLMSKTILLKNWSVSYYKHNSLHCKMFEKYIKAQRREITHTATQMIHTQMLTDISSKYIYYE